MWRNRQEKCTEIGGTVWLRIVGIGQQLDEDVPILFDVDEVRM